jgi:CubicO group peptidase (beta-lactamase class C family)
MKIPLLRIGFLSLFITGLVLSATAQQANGNEEIFSQIRQEAEAIGSVRSLLIQQNGERLLEQYYHGMQPGRKMNTKSASKSIISLLVGIAVEEGIINSIDDPIAQYLPEYFEDISNEKKQAITVKNLLTMRSGLETTSFHNYGRWVTSDDWVRYVLEQPMIKEPGGEWAYSTGSSHLLSVIITKTSGMSTRAFANKYLFRPMNIEVGGWDHDPQGYYMGGNNLALSSEAMMKIGQMLLNGGTWNGKRIISELWMNDSFKSYTRSNYNPYNYGYLWWNRPVAGHKVYFAWGYGGQYIFMIPDLDAVVVILSSLNTATQRREYKEPVFRLLRRLIIPQLLEAEAVSP